MSESSRHSPALSSFDEAYEQHLDYVWRTLGRLGVTPSDLPDAVHDVFLLVYRKWSERDAERPIRPWLFGIARKHASTWRRKRREVPRDDLDPAAPPAGASDAHDLVWRALESVGDGRREVVILHELDELTAPEIAAVLEVPLNTVYSRLRIGRAELVDALRLLGAAR